MKKIIQILVFIASLCFLALLFPATGNAQNNFWSTAQALTDSASDNLNGTLIEFGSKHLLFWERKTDSATSEICMRDIYSLPFSAEQVVLALPATKLTNPVILNTDYTWNSPAFYLFYQTNEGNDTDIKYIKYYKNGTFSAPYSFATDVGDDINLHVYNNYPGLVSWENSGKLLLSLWNYSTETFSSPILVDSGGASSPVFYNVGYNMAWLKHGENISYLKFVELGYQGDTIQIQQRDSVQIDAEVARLNCNHTGMFFPFGWHLAFQKRAFGSDKWGLCYAEMEQTPPQLTDYKSANYNYESPVIWDILIYVKDLGYSNYAFVSDSLGNREVFATPNWFGKFPSDVENISDYSGDDRNPSVFSTSFFAGTYYIRTQLLWESFRNGHWTIYRSFYDIIPGSTGQSLNADNMVISPNPFKDQVSLRSNSSFPADQVNIMNLSGQCIRVLEVQPSADGWSGTTWDGNDMHGNKMPAGAYVACFFSKSGNTSKLIMKSN